MYSINVLQIFMYLKGVMNGMQNYRDWKYAYKLLCLLSNLNIIMFAFARFPKHQEHTKEGWVNRQRRGMLKMMRSNGSWQHYEIFSFLWGKESSSLTQEFREMSILHDLRFWVSAILKVTNVRSMFSTATLVYHG